MLKFIFSPEEVAKFYKLTLPINLWDIGGFIPVEIIIIEEGEKIAKYFKFQKYFREPYSDKERAVTYKNSQYVILSDEGPPFRSDWYRAIRIEDKRTSSVIAELYWDRFTGISCEENRIIKDKDFQQLSLFPDEFIGNLERKIREVENSKDYYSFKYSKKYDFFERNRLPLLGAVPNDFYYGDFPPDIYDLTFVTLPNGTKLTITPLPNTHP